MPIDNSTSQLHSPEAKAKAKATREAKKALGLPTLRQAIDQNCRDCLVDASAGLGTWRKQVEGCTVTSCAIYPIRARSTARNIDASPDSACLNSVSSE